MFWLSGLQAYDVLAPPQGTTPKPPALKGEVLTTGASGKSLIFLIFDRL